MEGGEKYLLHKCSSSLADIANGLTRMQLIASTAGWSTSLTGSASSSNFPTYLYVSSGATASSVGIAYARILGNDLAGVQSRLNYAKSFRLSFILSVSDVANSLKYIQIKTATTHGDLAEKGLGIKLNNLSLKGESYGTLRQEIDLMTLSLGTEYLITIEFVPGVKVDFYVNGVPKGTITTSDKIPTGITAANTNYLISTSNDSTALSSNIYISPITMRAEV